MDEIKPYPPKLFLRIFRWYCKPNLKDHIEGDLIEVYRKRIRKKGKRNADIRFAIGVLLLFRRDIIRPLDGFKNLKNYAVYRSYLKIGCRNLLRNKGYSTINIIGLAIGMAACFVIIQYVDFEESYDKFHDNSKRLYRVTIERAYPTSTIREATAHPGVGPELKNDFSEVEEYARIIHQSIFAGEESTWTYIDEKGEEKIFNERRVYSADPTFLTLFSFPLIYGDREIALSDESAVLISRSTAEKFFGKTDPRGKTLVMNGNRNLTVTGVFYDVPENSHIKFDILVSYFLLDVPRFLSAEGFWKWAEYYTYVLLKPDADPASLESKFDSFADRHMGEYMRRMNFREHFHLQPLKDIHLRSPEMIKEREVHGSALTVNFLSIIAALILIIAWTNYINLSMSQSIQRAREIGVRKISGATKRMLIGQFLFEAVLINLVSLIVAFILIAVTLPYFNQIVGKKIGHSIMNLSLLHEPSFWAALFAIIVCGSFLAGLYPAFVLSSFKVVTVLKGKYFGDKSNAALRRALVGLQFMISASLIAGTVIVYRQVAFMRNHELGYAKEQLLIIKSPRVGNSIRVNMRTLRTELERNADIIHVVPTSEIPGRQLAKSNFIRKYEDGREDQFLCNFFFTDHNFLPTYDIQLKAGRNFDASEFDGTSLDDRRPITVLVNERAAQLLQYKSPEDAINSLINFGWGGRDHVAEIIGVVANYHQRSLKENYDPIIYISEPNAGIWGQYLSINMKMGDPAGTISFIENQYKRFFPGNRFEYFFMDDFFDRQYAADQQFGSVFGSFSGLALFVATLGLLSLSQFMITQRTKEIAIRKVLGASISSMIVLFYCGFFRLILIANLIAMPFVYFLGERWLGEYAFRTEIGWLIFLTPLTILVIISLATVGTQTTKTGLMNPVKALRSE